MADSIDGAGRAQARGAALPAWYQLVLVAALPLVWLRLWWRGRRNPAYRARRRERLGYVPATVPVRPIWFHTVSAGETMAAAPLIERLVRAFPEQPFLVTTMTPTGSAQVQRLLGDRVAHCYAPYDFRFAVRRFLERVQPRLLVLMETELWPNLVVETAAQGARVLLVNARLSARSARGYGRVASLTRPMLQRLDWVACQYPDHARRFVELGLPCERASVVGTVKFDIALPADFDDRVAALRNRWLPAERPVWIAASVHEGEDDVVLRAHKRVLEQLPDALLLLVPKHPERFDPVTALAQRDFTTVRISRPDDRTQPFQVLIGDTVGQLRYYYGLAQVAFVGGSLVPGGGHNPIEPALAGVPILMGPHDFNFPDVIACFEQAGCLQRVGDVATLSEHVLNMLRSPRERKRQGDAAREIAAENRGATECLFDVLSRTLSQQ